MLMFNLVDRKSKQVHLSQLYHSLDKAQILTTVYINIKNLNAAGVCNLAYVRCVCMQAIIIYLESNQSIIVHNHP